jgi:hypothetical protein
MILHLNIFKLVKKWNLLWNLILFFLWNLLWNPTCMNYTFELKHVCNKMGRLVTLDWPKSSKILIIKILYTRASFGIFCIFFWKFFLYIFMKLISRKTQKIILQIITFYLSKCDFFFLITIWDGRSIIIKKK